MARLMCVANGNNTSSSTWAVIDSTSYSESETANTAMPTSYSSSASLGNFTPGAITVDGIGIRIAARTGTTGTLSVELYNHTGAASVAGTEVTVNMTDVVHCSTTNLEGGWMFFKFSAPVTLLGATAYVVRFKTSSSSQCSIFTGGGLSTATRFLRTTTTQAPVAGDDRFIMGEWTAAATMTTRAVTADDTITIDYGSASTSLVTPALSISNGGTYEVPTSASTAYIQKISGNVVVYSGGTLKVGSSGSRMPSTSSLTWTMDCASNVDFGIRIKAYGTFSAYGESKQRITTLTSNVSAAGTIIPVTSTTGWKTSDTLGFTSTTTTVAQVETKAISTVDSSVQVTLGSGVTYAHAGTGDVVGEVFNLTGNVKILGTSTSVGTYIYADSDAIVTLDNVEIQYIGSGSNTKRGIESANLVGAVNTFTMVNCVVKDLSNSSGFGFYANTITPALVSVTNCVFYNTTLGGTGIITSHTGATAAANLSLNDNLVANFSIGVNLNGLFTGASVTANNLRISSCSTGLSNVSVGSVLIYTSDTSGHYIHSCTSGVLLNGGGKKSLTSCTIVANASSGLTSFAGTNVIESCNFYGNSSAVLLSGVSTVAAATYFNSCNFRSTSSLSQTTAVNVSTVMPSNAYTEFNNCNLGQTNAHTSADITVSFTFSGTLIFNNCVLASSAEITSTAYTLLDENGIISLMRKDGTASNHSAYIKQAIVTPDTTIYKTASPSLRITPKSASITASTRLMPFRAYVNSGQTCTPTVYVRESEAGDGAAYNGNRAKLYVKANYNLGITSDTLLDTATASSDGAWEGLTGTTAAVTDSGVLEFYVVVDGTTGWLNIDDFTFVNA